MNLYATAAAVDANQIRYAGWISNGYLKCTKPI